MSDPNKLPVSENDQQSPTTSHQPQNTIQQPYSAKRTLAQRRFKRAEKSLSDVLSQTAVDIPKTLLEQRYSELKQNWSEFQLAHDEFIVFGLKDADLVTINTEDNIIENFAKVFSNIEIMVHRKLRDMTDTDKTANTVAVGTLQQPFIKLERMKFPVFDGNARRYTSWKTDFDRYIKPFSSTEQLPLIIKQYLSDSVRRDVENLSEATDIWTRLERKYGSDQKVVDAVMHEIRCLSVKENDDSSILNFIRTIELANADLKKKSLESEMNNTTTVTLIERRLPKKMLLEWVEIATKLKPNEKFAQLLLFLEQWKHRIEYLSSDIRTQYSDKHECRHNNAISSNNECSHHNQQSYQNECSINNHHSNNEYSYSNEHSYNNEHSHNQCSNHKQRSDNNWRSPNNKRIHHSEQSRQQASGMRRNKCLIHKSEEHPIWTCRLYQRLPVKERIEIAKAHGACLSCLETGHTIEECQRRFKCPEAGCDQAHNHLLHE